MNFVEKNTGKLLSLSDRIVEGKVNLKLDRSATKDNKICDIKLVIPGNDLFASRQSNTFEGAVLGAIKAVRHQLDRWKDE